AHGPAIVATGLVAVAVRDAVVLRVADSNAVVVAGFVFPAPDVFVPSVAAVPGSLAAGPGVFVLSAAVATASVSDGPGVFVSRVVVAERVVRPVVGYFPDPGSGCRPRGRGRAGPGR